MRISTLRTERIVNARTDAEIALQGERAQGFLGRLRGLIGRRGLSEDEALIIPHCSMVHTCFMRFPIDVLFCSSSDLVVGIEASLKPWRLSRYYSSAEYVVELKAGRAEKLGIRSGDVLKFH